MGTEKGRKAPILSGTMDRLGVPTGWSVAGGGPVGCDVHRPTWWRERSINSGKVDTPRIGTSHADPPKAGKDRL